MKNGSRIPGNKGHVYWFDGYAYPSVTTIIHRIEEEDPALKRWRENYRSPHFKNAKEYTRYTSVRGIFVHYNILNTLSPFPLDPGELPQLSEWSPWKHLILDDIAASRELWEQVDIAVIQPAHIETPICHHGLWYAGTPDLVSKIKYEGETCYTLVDLKTSKKPRDTHSVQIGAYSQMMKHGAERGLLIYLNPAARKPDVVQLDIADIRENAGIFNTMRDEFYAIDGIDAEYGLQLPR